MVAQHSSDRSGVAEVAGQLDLHPTVIGFGKHEAALVDALAFVSQQHDASPAVRVEQCLQQRDPCRAEVLGFIHDDRVVAGADLGPVTHKMSERFGLPPVLVGIGGNDEFGHAGHVEHGADERTDGE